MTEVTAGQDTPSGDATLSRHHIDWLLVVAHTFQEQDMPEQAATILNFLRVFERGNVECLKLLSLVYFKLGDLELSEKYIQEGLSLSLSEQERAALLLLRTRVVDRSGRDPQASLQSYIEQLARLQNT